jgi:hypothetical protein
LVAGPSCVIFTLVDELGCGNPITRRRTHAGGIVTACRFNAPNAK